jgi:hypothetical protein
MSSSNFNLRGIPEEVMNMLKQEAKKINQSVNTLILHIIEKNLGFTRKKAIYHDLDHLANTWTKKEVKKFKENTKDFEKIDKDLWT